MSARARLALAAVDGASDGCWAVIVEHKVGMPAGSIQPAFDSFLRLRDRRTDGLFGGSAVGVGRCSCDTALPFEAIAQFVVSLPDVFAQDVPTSGFVLTEVARGTGLCCGQRCGLPRAAPSTSTRSSSTELAQETSPSSPIAKIIRVIHCVNLSGSGHRFQFRLVHARFCNNPTL